MRKTTVPKTSDIVRSWHIIDLEGKTLGRVASDIALLLMGKGKPYFTPHMDCGDYVVVINAEKIVVTGGKEQKKLYRHHTGRPGGFREYTFEQVQEKDPREIIVRAVRGMVSKNKLRAPRMKRLKVFVGTEHPYAQQLSQDVA